MAQHTPGPWFEQNADLNGATHYIVAGDRETLLGIWTEGTGLGSQAKANRQLMITPRPSYLLRSKSSWPGMTKIAERGFLRMVWRQPVPRSPRRRADTQ